MMLIIRCLKPAKTRLIFGILPHSHLINYIKILNIESLLFLILWGFFMIIHGNKIIILQEINSTTEVCSR